jgi:Putative auto-transporter adhesin, head GIN domain
MMRTTLLAGLLGILFLSSCSKVTGEGPVITEQRNARDFNAVSAEANVKVYFKTAPDYKLEVMAQQNILDVLETSVNNYELRIKLRSGTMIRSNQDIIVNISAPALEMVNLSGSGEFYSIGPWTTANCNLRVSGSGSINIPQIAIADKLTANISGSGGIKIQGGTVKHETLRVSGSGEMDLINLAAEKAVAEISGSGNIWVLLSQNLDATISGSGSVLYRGTPVVNARISGSGKVRPF